MYIHDWVSSSSVPVSGGSNNGYCWGGIDGATLVDHLTMSDANGWGTINGSRAMDDGEMQFGGQLLFDTARSTTYRVENSFNLCLMAI